MLQLYTSMRKKIAMLRKCLEEKDQRIKTLKENLQYAYDDFNEIQQENDKISQELEDKKELSFNLYVALSKTLEKEIDENIPSIIDQLIGKNCGKYSNMYNEYKRYKNKFIELRNYIMNYYDDGVDRPQRCNEYIRATCNDILEKMKRLKMI